MQQLAEKYQSLRQLLDEMQAASGELAPEAEIARQNLQAIVPQRAQEWDAHASALEDRPNVRETLRSLRKFLEVEEEQVTVVHVRVLADQGIEPAIAFLAQHREFIELLDSPGAPDAIDDNAELLQLLDRDPATLDVDEVVGQLVTIGQVSTQQPAEEAPRVERLLAQGDQLLSRVLEKDLSDDELHQVTVAYESMRSRTAPAE